MGKHFNNLEEYLKSKTIIDENTGCWLHQNINKSKGYAFAMFNYKQIAVHRISAYLYLNFDLTDKTLQVNHKKECSNLNCWNPKHLYIGTQYENMQDLAQTKGHNNGNTFKTHCVNGHEFTKENTYIRKDDNTRSCKICQKERDDNRIRINPHYKLEK